MPMEFKWRAGVQVPSDLTAKEAHDQLECIRERRGTLTAYSVADEIEEAGETHVLAPFFTFDGPRALRELHERQARDLLRAVVVVKVVEEQRDPVRCFVVVKTNGQQSYEPIYAAIRVKSKRDQILDDARRELHAFTTKMNELLELCRLVP